jgi:hypothetical protein
VLKTTKCHFFYHGGIDPSGPGAPHYRGFTITLRHTIFGRTPLDEWPARSRDLYETTHNTDTKQTFILPAEFELSPSKRAAADPRLRPRGQGVILVCGVLRALTRTTGLLSFSADINSHRHHRDNYMNTCPITVDHVPVFGKILQPLTT